MVFEHIEKLKREYTDKYVIVDGSQPELRRFEGQTGVIKTVNMNGSALVEFDGLLNIGWYDIGLDFLKVVDKPLPKEEPKKVAAKKPAAKPAAKSTGKPAAKPAAKPEAGGKMSVADMLAAARGEKGGAAPATKKEAPATKQAAPATKQATPAKKAAPGAPGKMSVADMLAAARAEKSGATATPEPEPEPVAESPPEPAVAPAATTELPKDSAGIVAYCRQVDG